MFERVGMFFTLLLGTGVMTCLSLNLCVLQGSQIQDLRREEQPIQDGQTPHRGHETHQVLATLRYAGCSLLHTPLMITGRETAETLMDIKHVSSQPGSTYLGIVRDYVCCLS